MSEAERVYTLLVAANPVPDIEVLPPSPADAPSTLHVAYSGRPSMQTQDQQELHAPAPPPSRPFRWIPAIVAAAVVVVVAIGVGAWAFGGSSSSVTDTPAPADDAVEPEAARAAAAVALIESFWVALDDGDIDAIVELLDPNEADRRTWEYNIVVARSYPYEVAGCEAVSTNDTYVTVECVVRTAEPVLSAMGLSETVWPWLVFSEGRIGWRPFTTVSGEGPGDVGRAMRDYLRLFHPTEYSATCDPSQYVFGTVNNNSGIALTAACADLVVPLSPDIAAWIDAGRPAP